MVLFACRAFQNLRCSNLMPTVLSPLGPHSKNHPLSQFPLVPYDRTTHNTPSRCIYVSSSTNLSAQHFSVSDRLAAVIARLVSCQCLWETLRLTGDCLGTTIFSPYTILFSWSSGKALSVYANVVSSYVFSRLYG